MRNQFLILDGHNLAYRCHFALAHLQGGDGAAPTHALLGFVKSLRALERIRAPTHHVVVFDGGLSADRLEACPEYKAQRPPMPDALRSQMALIAEYLQTAAIPSLRLEGTEADDVMASLAVRAAADGADVFVASSDKDMYQLIDDRIRILNFAQPEDAVDAAGTVRKFGVHPRQLGDVLALAGDTSDNIEGVPGIGLKTAARLISEFQSVDGLFAGLASVKSDRLRNSLSDHRTRVARNQNMVRLRTDVPGLPSWDTLRVNPPPADRLNVFFEARNLRSLKLEVRQPDLFDRILS